MHSSRCIAAILYGALAFPAHQSVAAETARLCDVRYELIDIGGGTRGIARALNDRGEVTGSRGEYDSSQAIVWDCASGVREIGRDLGYEPSEGVDINQHGLVLAQAFTPDGIVSPFLWDRRRGARVTEGIGALWPTMITNRGVVSNGYGMWSERSGLQWFDFVPTLIMDARINSSGRISGISHDGFGDSRRLFTWTQAGGLQDFGPAPLYTYETVDMNERGDVLVRTYASGFFFSRDGEIHALPLPPNAVGDRPVAFNDRRHIVGTVFEQGASSWGPERSVLWSAQEGHQYLDVLVFGEFGTAVRFRPSGINNWGWIAGASDDTAALAIPVPAHDSRYRRLGDLRGKPLCQALRRVQAHSLLCALRER